MVSMQEEIGKLTEESEELTRKIELARELPATILQTATIPVDGLTVEDGVPLIHGLPISNLSDGELLELCVDITVSKPGQLQIILIDGAERLDKQPERQGIYPVYLRHGKSELRSDSGEEEYRALRLHTRRGLFSLRGRSDLRW